MKITIFRHFKEYHGNQKKKFKSLYGFGGRPIVQAVPALRLTSATPSRDNQMFFKLVTRSHVYSSITYSDLNQQQIDLVNLT